MLKFECVNYAAVHTEWRQYAESIDTRFRGSPGTSRGMLMFKGMIPYYIGLAGILQQFWKMTAYLLHFSTSPILWFKISFRLLYMQRWEYGTCMLSGKNLFYNTSCESHVNLRQYTTHDCGLRLLAHLFWFACFQTEMISTLCYGSSAQITLVTLKRGNEKKINHHYLADYQKQWKAQQKSSNGM